jgi:tetratricopeptide (TPR) repeat protein
VSTHHQTAHTLQQAVILHRQGRIEEAARLYQAVLQSEPKEFDALHFLGLIRLRQGHADEAQKLLRRALNQQPGSAEANNSLGQILAALGRWEEARARYEKALAAKPDAAPVRNNLGIALSELGRHAAAVTEYRRAIALDPTDAAAMGNLGLALTALGRDDEAIASYEQALTAKPGFAEAELNLGNAHLALGRPAAALGWYEQAVRHASTDARMHNNLGRALQALNRHEAALASYAEAATLAPDYAGAQWNLALAHLALGNFAEGWAGYEWRWRDGELTPRALPAPLWTGGDLTGKTLLVHAEQGLGDTLQFARYLPLLAARGARVVFEAQRPLLPVLASLRGVGDLVAAGERLPPFDLQVPLLSLPGIFATTLDSIPRDIPYLRAPAERVAVWRVALAALPRPRIGLVWAGRPGNRNDRQRSLSLGDLAPLLDLPDASIVSLQTELRDGDAALLQRHPGVTLLGERLHDFADTAAVMGELDLVVSVDTAAAHLAGALGCALFLLLPFSAEWRWLRQREDSPWYPTPRLFRQPPPGDWEAVVAQVVAAVARLKGNE